jgi:hypothetical protein
MNITLLSVEVQTVPTAKGSYQKANVAYKNNSFQGKVAVSYTHLRAHETG